VYEVMAPSLDLSLWKERRRQLERDFVQDAIVVRAMRAMRM
jgi:hypothetical protein